MIDITSIFPYYCNGAGPTGTGPFDFYRKATDSKSMRVALWRKDWPSFPYGNTPLQYLQNVLPILTFESDDLFEIPCLERQRSVPAPGIDAHYLDSFIRQDTVCFLWSYRHLLQNTQAYPKQHQPRLYEHNIHRFDFISYPLQLIFNIILR